MSMIQIGMITGWGQVMIIARGRRINAVMMRMADIDWICLLGSKIFIRIYDWIEQLIKISIIGVSWILMILKISGKLMKRVVISRVGAVRIIAIVVINLIWWVIVIIIIIWII